MGLNKELIGKKYEPQEYTVTAEEAKKYAFGYNEDLPLFTDESHPQGLIAPRSSFRMVSDMPEKPPSTEETTARKTSTAAIIMISPCARSV